MTGNDTGTIHIELCPNCHHPAHPAETCEQAAQPQAGLQAALAECIAHIHREHTQS
ncbi:hypothetical protein ACFVX9_30465 [Kitasatospora sp. NPDC058243]|uniref:hypothetical protein n=1 Tax=Kitasatospora sp. NPDC058243 TaxID=3346397 RepID=UPI0036D9F22E